MSITKFLKGGALVALLVCAAASAFAQGAIQQAGPLTAGHSLVGVYNGIVQDSGPASGGGPGVGLSELLRTVRGTGTAPYANAGTGPLGTNDCNYDAPVTNPAGYHYLCVSPNAQGGGLIAYGAGGGASPLPMNVSVNGTTYGFPFTIGGIVGPATSVIGDVMVWNNATGSLAKDTGVLITSLAPLNSPTFITPVLGVATATTLNGNTFTTGTGTLTLGAGKTATISNTLTFTGIDASSVAFGTGGTVVYSTNALLNGAIQGPLTGDVTTSGSAATLATVNSNVGTFTNATVTADGKGRITAVSTGSATAVVAVAGDTRNLVVSFASATSLTIAADQIVMATGLSGTPYLEASPSHTFNGASTGAGGMDTGSLPTSGYVCLYEITKGDGTTYSTLGMTAGTCSTIYGGAHMPSGYVASALIGIWPTNGSAQFPVGKQLARKFWYQTPLSIFTGVTGATSLTSRSIAAGVPTGAKTADIVLGSAAAVAGYYTLSSDTTGTGAQGAGPNVHSSETDPIYSVAAIATFLDQPILTSQTVWWADQAANTDDKMFVRGFTF